MQRVRALHGRPPLHHRARLMKCRGRSLRFPGRSTAKAWRCAIHHPEVLACRSAVLPSVYLARPYLAAEQRQKTAFNQDRFARLEGNSSANTSTCSIWDKTTCTGDTINPLHAHVGSDTKGQRTLKARALLLPRFWAAHSGFCWTSCDTVLSVWQSIHSWRPQQHGRATICGPV